MKTLLPLLGVLLLSNLSAHGALEWQNLEENLTPKLTDKTTTAHFKYKNTGDKPVKITAVKPSCGCTTAALAKDVVAPGESGEIAATFHIGERVGVQTKTINVTTDEPGDKGTVLKLKADVPTLLSVTPSFLYWSKNQPVAERTIEVKVGGDFPVTKLVVTSTDPDIATEVKPVPNEKAFRILVKPKLGNRPINAALKIEPDFPKDPPRTFYANVRIDAHPAASAEVSPAPSTAPN